ncbi:MAG: ABC transporter ATP-binding protein [Longimicrobiales bacterium]
MTSIYRRILGYLRPHRWIFALGAVATALFAALDTFSFVLLIPFLETVFGGSDRVGGATGTLGRWMDGTVGRVVDLHGDPQAAVQGIIVFILVVVALKNVVDFARNYLVARVEQGVTRDMRNGVYEHLLDLDLAFFAKTRTGQIVSRLTHDVEQLRTLVTKELAKTLSSVLEFGAALFWMLMISRRLTLAAFIVVPVTMVIWGPLVRRLRRRDRRVLDLAGEVTSHIQETVSGIRLVKAAAAEPAERSRFRGLTNDYFVAFLRTVKLRALAAPITEMLVAVGTAILLWYGARMVVVDGSLSGEAFIAFIVLSTKLYAPVKYLSKLPALIQPGLVGAERVFEFLDAPSGIQDSPDARPFTGLEGQIEYNGVCLEYRPGEPMLQDVSFSVPKGSVVALVGPSGAGKTSLVDVLGRFYDVTGGAVLFDGVDIRSMRIDSLRSAFGIVSQDTVLFHDTVAANIAYGNPGATREQIESAAKAAHADEFIRVLPEMYDTLVGERGTTLSGGQRQRIAIARAILSDPPILVFDEATSALDAESERLIQEAISRLLEGRTVFVIAHRLSTIQRADLIVVVDEGRVVQSGTHASLLAEGGLYRRLHDLQFP